MQTFLNAQQTKILDGKKSVRLHGVNFGGWLMMEGYIMYAPNIAERIFKKNFADALGSAALQEFEKIFRANFIQERDFKTVADLGFNCVRVPFNSRLVEKSPGRYDLDGVRYLDEVVRWGEKRGVRVILDLHAACGAQNHDWHSDSLGPADLWQKKSLQDRTVALWEFLADRYKDKKAVAGYDLLNEAVLDDTKLLNRFYKRLIKAIRAIDRRHILFVEGNRWAQDLECLEPFDDDNLVLSIHFYEPLNFTFNLVPHFRYPIKSPEYPVSIAPAFQKIDFDRTTIQKMMEAYKKSADKQQRPVYVGEFGVNYREGYYGEDQWLKDALDCFTDLGFHWTYWTYKAMKNGIIPDGVFSYYHNPPWVNRHGPRYGWDNYATHWPSRQREVAESWQTNFFKVNTKVAEALTKAAQKT